MTPFQLYIALLNTILVCSGLIVAIYFVRSYNILVKAGVTNTPIPIRESRPVSEDRIKLTVKFQEINEQRDFWRKAGYSVVSWNKRRDVIDLVMTKKLDATR